MSFFSSFRSLFSATSENIGHQSSGPIEALNEGNRAIGVDGALQIATVWRCIELYVNTISTLPLFTYREDLKGQKTLDRNTSLYKMLHDSPNPRMTSAEFLGAMVLNRKLRGNGYAQITRGQNGEAVGLYPLSADQTEPFILEDGTLVYRHSTAKGLVIIAAENMLHWKGLGNGVTGLSALDYMRSTTTETANAQDHANKTFANMAKPAGILMVDRKLNPEQREMIRNSFSAVASGSNARLFVLESHMKYEPTGMTPADIQLLDTRKFGVEEIARRFGVPMPLVNAIDLNSFEQILAGWFKLDVRPLLEQLEQAIEKRVLTPQQRADTCVEFSFDGLLRGDTKTRFEIYSKSVQNGLMSRNEARQLENLPRVDGGDSLTAQVNLAPLELLGKTPSSNAPALDAPTLQ